MIQLIRGGGGGQPALRSEFDSADGGGGGGGPVLTSERDSADTRWGGGGGAAGSDVRA